MTISTQSLSQHTNLVCSAMMMTKPTRTYTVYLVRHGEAVHNVEEKIAKNSAKQSCLERGLAADDKETLKSMDDARKQVLKDPTFFDAEITEKGKEEARSARDTISKCMSEGLPAPRQVITSPLQRCLGTVEEIFPEREMAVRVEEDLRERLTGRPADNRLSSDGLEERFPRFDFGRLKSLSQSNLGDTSLADSDVSSTSGFDDSSRQSSFDMDVVDTVPPRRPFGTRLPSSLNTNVELEDDNAVRKRAFQLFRMLNESASDSVAVVTHKGFLRALERGCFGIDGSPEFKNCEVRVYQIEMAPDNELPERIERLR